MVIDVILVVVVSAVVSLCYFLARVIPLFRKRLSDKETAGTAIREGLNWQGFYLLERHLHEYESPEAIQRPQPFAGANATLSAARAHFAIGDAYQDAWHQRYAWEPAAHRRDTDWHEAA